MRELDKVLDTNEQVLWEGKPRFWQYMLTGAFEHAFAGFVILLVCAGFLSIFLLSDYKTQGEVPIVFIYTIISLFALPGLYVVFFSHIVKWIGYRYLYYAITNKRVIFQSGIIGRDFEFIDFDQVTNSEVDVGFWDKVFKGDTGSIFISSAGSFTIGSKGRTISTPYTLCNIDNPYEIFKFFKKTSHDVKTDMSYPNAMRPESNPGYQSEYEPRR